MPVLSDFSCQYLKGVGPKNALKLKKRGIETAKDILFHFPLRYEDRTHITSIAQIALSNGHKTYVILGKIIETHILYKPKPQLFCIVEDDTGQITLRFIHYAATQKEKLKIGRRIFIVGEVRAASMGLEMIHPTYRLLSETDVPPLGKTLTPIYSTSEGLGQSFWLSMTEQVLLLLQESDYLQELLPQSVIKHFQLTSLVEAFSFIHRPSKDTNIDLLEKGYHPAQYRLILEELLAHRLATMKRREHYVKYKAHALCQNKEKFLLFLAQLPFSLTEAQNRVIKELHDDLKKQHPMMRLLQGDVGSGKTVVAAAVVVTAVHQGKQAAIMAPTELLAEQHYKVMQYWFQPLNINTALLTGAMSKRHKQTILKKLMNGEIQVLIGTHALFQNEIEFKDLALIVIDEQHRFGVSQRLALKQKGIDQGYAPHQLIMTATPIPRTLAMSLYSDLDYSILDQLPSGRQAISTLALSNARRDEIVSRIYHLTEKGQQAYWVCPLIEESDVLQCQAAEKTYEQLQEQLPSLRIALLHGKMRAKEKEAIMALFKKGDIDVLVATTVIEVGVDVPNASLMVIENAERLGLSQLHQLRGRVGRGALASYCILLYQAPLGKIARARIAMLRSSQDGFKIAEKDLELRGAGEILGTRQTGNIQFKIANLVRDYKWLLNVQKIADELWLSSPEVIDLLIHRWLDGAEIFGGV